MSDIALKTKVGALILVAVTLLVGFVVLLGSFSVGPQVTLHLEFADSGSILTGAPVKIAGVRAGRVETVEFLAGREARRSAPRAGEDAPINVRLTIHVDAKMAESVRQDSQFIITTQGVLGEKYLEIVPGTAAAPAWEDGATIRGRDPARIDVLFTRVDGILSQVEAALGADGDLDIGGLVQSLTRLTKNLDSYVADNRARLDRITENLAATSDDLRAVMGAVRTAVGDGAQLAAIVDDVKRTSGVIARRADPLTRSLEATLARADASLNDVQALLARNGPAIDEALADLPHVTGGARAITRDVSALLADLGSGRGTVGQLLVDQELYDDLKEMLRDIKRHPWKMLWRE